MAYGIEHRQIQAMTSIPELNSMLGPYPEGTVVGGWIRARIAELMHEQMRGDQAESIKRLTEKLAAIETSVGGIHEHARKPPVPTRKTWGFWLGLVGAICGALALLRDFFDWKWPLNHAGGAQAIESNQTRPRAVLRPLPESVAPLPDSKGEAPSAEKTQQGSPAESKTEPCVPPPAKTDKAP